MTALAKLSGSTIGLTPMVHEGDRATFASVSYDRIELEVHNTDASTAQILGYAIAHELGHMLLRTSHHSSVGIMIAKWGPVDLRRAAEGLLGFTPQQAEYMRAEIADREKTQQGSPEIASSALLNKPIEVRVAGPIVRALRQPALIGDDQSRIATHTEVPFKLYGNYTIVARGSVGDRHKLKFLIDTRSSSTVVDGSLARKLRLARSSRKIAVFASVVTTEEVVLPSLQLGSLRATLLPAVVRDLSYFQDSLSAHVDVIVGIDVLSRTSFTVDYEARKLTLGPAERFSNSVACDPRSPYPTVALRLDNRTVRVLVDTGAQELALFEKRPRGLARDSHGAEEETRTGMAGQVVIKRAEFHEMALGTSNWPRREGLFMEAPSSLFDGLLGPRWLGAKRIAFDFEHKVISWEK
jgi:predicted aspartyl protease